MAEAPPNADARARAHYDEPRNREPDPNARVVRRGSLPRATLDRHVPVRFSHETIEAVTGHATEEGLSVSAWIRRAVDVELRRHADKDVPARAELLRAVRRAVDEALGDAIARMEGAGRAAR